MARNPYESRQTPRERADSDGRMAAWGGLSPGPMGSPMQFRDLEAMVHSAVRRGRDEADAEHVDRERVACHQAWEMGFRNGVAEGRGEMLTDIEARVGSDTLNIHKRCALLLAQVGEDPRRVTKADLERTLDSAADMLARLIDAHHQGFARDLPF